MTQTDTFARRLAVWLAVAPLCLFAQVEPVAEWQRQQALARLPELARQAPSTAWRTHLQGLAAPSTPAARQAAVNAVRVALDVTNAVSETPFIHYAVPPMS